MVNNIITSPFEHEIQQLLAVSEPRESFREDLYNQLQTQTPSRANQPRSLILKPAFIAILIAILMFAASLFYFGPETVYAAITRLFDYIPGIGLVDQDAQIRVLKEPVSQTRDGITITVNEAFLTEDRTEIHYGVSGVPLSAYPRNEASYEGSLQPDYLLLPDGRRLEMGEPIPADVNEAILMIPCIFNTLPDTVPTNWEFPLEFIPLPEDATIYPVQESTAQPEKTSLPKPESRITQESTDTDEQKKDGVIHIEKTIQTDTGYILIGAVEVNSEQDAWINMQGMPQISDADNTKIPVTFPYDIQLSNTDNNAIAWAGQFDAADVTFPITLTMYGEKFSKVTSESPIRIPFNAGESLNPGKNGILARILTLEIIDCGWKQSAPQTMGILSPSTPHSTRQQSCRRHLLISSVTMPWVAGVAAAVSVLYFQKFRKANLSLSSQIYSLEQTSTHGKRNGLLKTCKLNGRKTQFPPGMSASMKRIIKH